VLQLIKDKLPPNGFKLSQRQSLFGMAGIAAAIALGVAYYLWSDQGAFRPLYGAGEAYPAAEVMQVLDSSAIAYQLHPQSGQVMVRADLLSQARMLLASNGVQVKVPAGYELFDKDEPLGTSQFVQDVRLKRSLEGELARTIMGLKGVAAARVHLALEESSSFVINKREPGKASVVLQMTAGQKLAPEQVTAIVNLVAASVPQLSTSNVQVVDQFGALLSRGLGMSGPQQNWQVVSEFQNQAMANAESVLAPILGSGNYRISVNADIDFSEKEETVQTYGDQPRLRNEVLRDESVLDQLALGVPGSLANRPPQPAPTPAAAPGGAGDTKDKGQTSLRTEANRQMDYDQSVTHVKHAPFSLRQQSIAVVLNADTAPEGGWSDQARQDLDAMIKSAVGFNAKRGDVLTLSVFPFSSAATDLAAAGELPWWENSSIHDWAKLGLLGLICLLLLWMVVRPAMRSLTQNRSSEAQAVLPKAADEPLALSAELLAARHLSGESVIPGATVLGELNPLAEIYLPAPGSGLEMQIEHLQMLAKNDPERVSEVLKQWIGRNERDSNPAA
jgi:flagellar M-ring protein FliF